MYATLHASETAVAAARALAAPAGDGLGLLVDLVCAEAGVYEPAVARTALRQADGDPARAVGLLRVWSATLPSRVAQPLAGADRRLVRRISSAFAEVPGGQWLGAAPQLRSRLLESDSTPVDGSATRPGPDGGTDLPPGHDAVGRAAPAPGAAAPEDGMAPDRAGTPRVADVLADLPLHRPAPEPDGPDPIEHPLTPPFSRGARLGALARGETGALVALAGLCHASQREEVLLEATTTVATLRVAHPRTGAPVVAAEVPVTEAEVVTDADVDGRPGFAVGYGVSLGRVDRRATAIAIIDGGLQVGAALSEGAVLAAVDGLATTGFVEHLCLPHYASFASYLSRVGEPA